MRGLSILDLSQPLSELLGWPLLENQGYESRSTTSLRLKFYTHINKFLLKSKGRSRTSQACDARPREEQAFQVSLGYRGQTRFR